ncbi:transcriptional regulator [Actinoplanes siamensis]|uniref:Uncharacterized protein n=1 Tax=Actinoplanes siamensis TaxID=1223317 RepID=A0A919NCK0_9ACTN|nr:transcriptional regulator [Actinoplanes siamensis]GIF08249.1 hypothetical protein Asi03nite_57870 [Actinoplanes siamensis]
MDENHVRTLAELDEKLPAVLVHRASMTLVDGMHRISAARRNGRDTVEVRFFHGTEAEAFQLAVRMNVRHGLPLSRTDRRTAAARILAAHPEQSDRSIAATTGLSARTVATIRRQTAARAQPVRLGQDGRSRPLTTAEGRRLAGEVIKADPATPLRKVAAQAGVSVGTARDVRARILAGTDPVPARRSATPSRPMDAPVKLAPPGRGFPAQCRDAADVESLLDGLRRDPSLRYTEAGRSILMWLNSGIPRVSGLPEVVHRVPPHCGIIIAQIARQCAQVWSTLADEMDRLSECA